MRKAISLVYDREEVDYFKTAYTGWDLLPLYWDKLNRYFY